MPVPRKSLILFYTAAVLCAGCAKRAVYRDAHMAVDDAESRAQGRTRSVPMLAEMSASFGAGGSGIGSVFAASRFVAVRHKLEIVEPGSGLPKSIEAVVAGIKGGGAVFSTTIS